MAQPDLVQQGSDQKAGVEPEPVARNPAPCPLCRGTETEACHYESPDAPGGPNLWPLLFGERITTGYLCADCTRLEAPTEDNQPEGDVPHDDA